VRLSVAHTSVPSSSSASLLLAAAIALLMLFDSSLRTCASGAKLRWIGMTWDVPLAVFRPIQMCFRLLRRCFRLAVSQCKRSQNAPDPRSGQQDVNSDGSKGFLEERGSSYHSASKKGPRQEVGLASFAPRLSRQALIAKGRLLPVDSLVSDVLPRNLKRNSF
jgi:hypothetical protein